MAPHAQHPDNHFSQSSEYPTDYNNLDDCYHLANDLNHPLSSDSNSHANNGHEPLRVHVERVVRQYFVMLGDEIPTDLYELILKEIERPLLSVVLEQTRGNQTKCAQILGLNRGTLRKKLKTYDLM